MIRRLVFAVCLMSFVSASPGHAAAPEPVEGAGSFNDAPVLTSGTYRDTIRNNEFVFYAVDLAEGQRLRIRARMTSAPGQPGLTGGISLSFYSPWRVQDIYDESPGLISVVGAGGAVSRMRGRTPSVGAGIDGSERAALYREPGRYYFGFINGVRRPKLEHALRFTLEIEGRGDDFEIVPDPTPSIAGTPGAGAPEATEGPTPGPSPDDAPGPPPADASDPGLVRLALAGLLGGFAGGTAVGYVRRRR